MAVKNVEYVPLVVDGEAGTLLRVRGMSVAWFRSKLAAEEWYRLRVHRALEELNRVEIEEPSEKPV